MLNKLPQTIESFIRATNKHDTDGLLATLADDAILIDESQNYRGISEIKNWSDEKYIGANVTLVPIAATTSDGATIVTVKVDGNFDKTGLPNPFLMDYHFTSDDSKISAISIRLTDE